MSFLLSGALFIIIYPLLTQSLAKNHCLPIRRALAMAKPTPTPTPFDPNSGAVLPTHRVVAFYAIPNAEATGPAYELTSSMLNKLQAQGAAYQQLDPEHYSFVQMAIDPEWMFPRHDGIPGINLSNVRSSDLNPIIEALAALPMQYHVPRKILLIHQYRSDGDGLKNPYDAGLAEIADKGNLLNDPLVDVVIHVDSVGGYVGDQADKTWQYNTWVGRDMQTYHNFRYGGFKLFYHIEARTVGRVPTENCLCPRSRMTFTEAVSRPSSHPHSQLCHRSERSFLRTFPQLGQIWLVLCGETLRPNLQHSPFLLL
jgi:hypothetical protein